MDNPHGVFISVRNELIYSRADTRKERRIALCGLVRGKGVCKEITTLAKQKTKIFIIERADSVEGG
jgi:hypothetical protein